jgi:hypothetical protein
VHNKPFFVACIVILSQIGMEQKQCSFSSSSSFCFCMDAHLFSLCSKNLMLVVLCVVKHNVTIAIQVVGHVFTLERIQ